MARSIQPWVIREIKRLELHQEPLCHDDALFREAHNATIEKVVEMLREETGYYDD